MQPRLTAETRRWLIEEARRRKKTVSWVVAYILEKVVSHGPAAARGSLNDE